MVKDLNPFGIWSDIATIYKPKDRLVLNMALWQTFPRARVSFYVGDAGIVELVARPNALVDFGAPDQLTDWLYAYGDINYTMPEVRRT